MPPTAGTNETLPSALSSSSAREDVSAPQLQPQVGTRLGRYLLNAPIASGGMAEVWRATHEGELGFRRVVALKTIRPDFADNHSFRKMFLEEARLVSQLRHANIVEIIDLGEAGPIVFQAMALVDGDSLAGLLRRWREDGRRYGLPAAITTRAVADAMRGLHAAHELKDETGTALHLVHRDVSPHNILVGRDGVAKVADFGIAKAFGRGLEETKTGEIKGKAGYFSPEQIAQMDTDRRSDLFAAGVVLWELLTGTRLFRGKDFADTLQRVSTLPVPDPRTVVPDLSAEIVAVTLRALNRDPAARYATAEELADALEAAGRASNALATTKEVGQLVETLCGPPTSSRVVAVASGAPQREPPVVVGARKTDADRTLTVALAQEPDPPSTTKATTSRRRSVAVIGAVVLVLGVSSGFFVARRGQQPSPVPDTNAGTSLPASAALVESPPPPSESTASADPTAPRASASASATTIASVRPWNVKLRPRPNPTTATSAAPAKPEPKFENPYRN